MRNSNEQTMPRILRETKEGECMTLDMEVDSDLLWFRGHFPGHPILPGVVQLAWAASFAERHFGVSATPCEILRLKFKHVAVPPLTMQLRLTRRSGSEVQFEFAKDEQQYSQGCLKYEDPLS
jgi:3-hydroxymyristoyl/3-hydroxydecanoyl-(acyl carrier protein) dehydratase